jgi:hypothetical protein
MRKFLILLTLFSPTAALAHEGGEGVQCFVQVPEVDCGAHPERCTFVANETSPEWRECHDTYWLCVDALRSIQVSYEMCVGAEWQLAKLLKRKSLTPNTTVMFYPFPQHPIEGLRANDLPWCRQELQACRDTAGPWLGELAICERQRLAREKTLRRKL